VPGGAQDFQLDDVSGHRFQLSDHLGRSVVVLDFWATWCDPCKVELPRLAELHEKYRGRGLVMVGIAVDGPESIAQVRGEVRQMRIPFPVLLDQESRVVAMYNPRRSAPYVVVIDRAGRIAHQHEGYTPGDEVGLAREIELALGP
jgi:peroxiredoxin